MKTLLLASLLALYQNNDRQTDTTSIQYSDYSFKKHSIAVGFPGVFGSWWFADMLIPLSYEYRINNRNAISYDFIHLSDLEETINYTAHTIQYRIDAGPKLKDFFYGPMIMYESGYLFEPDQRSNGIFRIGATMGTRFNFGKNLFLIARVGWTYALSKPNNEYLFGDDFSELFFDGLDREIGIGIMF